MSFNSIRLTTLISVVFFCNHLFAHGGAIEMDLLSPSKFFASKTHKLKIGIFTDEGHKIQNFKMSHEKLIHSMIISKDRRHFAHLHPIWDKKTGTFNIELNRPTFDFDNFQAARAFPEGGEYVIYSEVIPHGQMEAALADYEVEVFGPKRRSQKIRNDRHSANGIFSKYFRRGKRNSASTRSGNYKRFDYKVTMKVKQMKMGGKNMLHFDFNLFRRSGFRKIKPITHWQLSNWLGMPGHAVLVSDNHDDIFHMHYPYMEHDHGDMNHGESHSTHAKVSPNNKTFSFMLPLDDKKMAELREKNVSIWAQFRLSDRRGARDYNHKGKLQSAIKSQILTVPFRFNLKDVLPKKHKHTGHAHH